MQHVRLGFGQRRGRREGEGKSSSGNSLDREHRFSPVSKPSRPVTPAQQIQFGCLVLDAHVAGALRFLNWIAKGVKHAADRASIKKRRQRNDNRERKQRGSYADQRLKQAADPAA
jgi:hypothetical protein